MSLHFTDNFEKKIIKLCQKDRQLGILILKQLIQFEHNPLHRSLKLHKLKGNRSTQYAIWIKANLRALCIKDENVYIFFDIVTHDQY